MMLNVKNLGDEAELIASPNGAYLETIGVGATLSVDQPRHDVLILGDKPDARDVIEQGVGALAEVAKRVVSFVLNRKRARRERGYASAEPVSFEIENLGASSLRAILGDGVTDVTIAAGSSATLSATGGYVELRELGLVETPESADPGKQAADE